MQIKLPNTTTRLDLRLVATRLAGQWRDNAQVDSSETEGEQGYECELAWGCVSGYSHEYM